MSEREPWTPEAVERVLRVLAETGAARFRLSLAGEPSFTLEWEHANHHRQSAVPSTADAAVGNDAEAAHSHTARQAIVSAPLLGVFYRRPAPGEPPFVEEGQAVTEGAVVALIEVMKTFHEVVAPRAGTLAEFFVGDGATVQFGDPLARLA